jgi:sigma-B regulation protein RsbU (phosphoserine phosphatase)
MVAKQTIDRNDAYPALRQQIEALEHDLGVITEELIARQDELVVLYELSKATRNRLDSERILQAVLPEMGRLFRPKNAFAVLKRSDGVVTLHHPQPFLAEAQVLAWFEEMAAQARPLMSDGGDVPTVVPQDGLNALLMTPLVVRGAVVGGLGMVDSDRNAFSFPERKRLRVVAEHVAAHLENAWLHEEVIAQTRVQSELALARSVQMRLLPQRVPQVHGVALAASSQPALEVGGDFYDFTTSHGGLHLMVGDVSGKGLSAALLMGMTRTALRGAARAPVRTTPAAELAQVNALLYDDFTDVSMFATVFVAHFDANQRVVHYANAGHSPIVYCPADGVPYMLEADGAPLGVLPTTFSEDHALRLGVGDLLIVATDGLSEESDSAGNLFGYERLLRAVETHRHKSAETIAAILLDDVRTFGAGNAQSDDQTLLVLKGIN